MRPLRASVETGFALLHLLLDKSIAFDEMTEQGNLRNLQSTTCSLGKVLTLGDSYASGTGIHLFPWEYDQLRGGTSGIGARTFQFNPNGGYCYREFDTTPGGRLATALGQQHIQMGCAAAEIDQIEEQFEYASQVNPLETYLGWEGSTIVVFAGGNDIRSRGGDGWSGVIMDCILEQGDALGCDDILSNRISNFDMVDEHLTHFYNQLALKAGNARIRIMGYPKLMQPHQVFGCSVLGISLPEAGWIDDHVDILNGRISQAVARTQRDYPAVDIEFVGVEDPSQLDELFPSAPKKQAPIPFPTMLSVIGS